MRRAQRRLHANLWPLIALLMLAVLAVAVVVREHPAPPANVEAP
ncbi:MAG: hypothetical protein ACKVRO_00585 [Micropepsaceae bacterium]